MAADKQRRHILAIDGGGIRCLIAIEVLLHLERELGARSGDGGFRLGRHFDLVAGTSGGALIAGAIALGIPMQEIRDFVVANAKHMFRAAPWLHRLHSWYDKDGLEHNLRDWFGEETTLGSPRLETLVAASDDLLYCTVREQDVLCRTFGECITGDAIDEELGNMIGPSARILPPLFTYHRVNVALNEQGLRSIDCAGVDPATIRPVDCVDQVGSLCEVGAKLGPARLSPYTAAA